MFSIHSKCDVEGMKPLPHKHRRDFTMMVKTEKKHLYIQILLKI